MVLRVLRRARPSYGSMNTGVSLVTTILGERAPIVPCTLHVAIICLDPRVMSNKARCVFITRLEFAFALHNEVVYPAR